MFSDIHLQRTFLSLLLPPASLYLLIALGLLMACARLRRTGRGLVAVGLLLIYLLSLTPVAAFLLRPLEVQHPALSRASADAIVVLVAGARDRSRVDLGAVPDASSLRRLVEGVRLYRGQPEEVPFIVCGGRADPAHPEISIGAVVGRAAVELGIPEEGLLVEDASTNTLEGAEQVSALFEERFGGPGKIILVTSAFHLGRAADFFRQAGFIVIPAPTDFQGQSMRSGLHAFIPSAMAMQLSATALSEYLVRLRYLFL